jgi:peptidoglycan/xylan/chitin deacetylase (PgdA/CDA1 family)
MDAILTFHSVDDSGSVLSYRPDDFAALVDGLLAAAVRIVPISALLAGGASPHDRVALTFDDGIRTVRTAALPVLARHRLPATVYVVSAWTGRTNRWPTQPSSAPTFDLMGWDELAELRDAGIEIASHGVAHAPMDTLTPSELTAELVDSKRSIEDALQVEARHFAYPYGACNADVAAAARRVYASAVTTRLQRLRPTSIPHLLPRLDTYYLQGPWARRRLFGLVSRSRLRVRGWLRSVREGYSS